eukprot:CAMPEP_0194321472 /NCGR_PEP_ID=MMETSP0171-20130528/17682_1 /TAXON_ID=218684 /ORGANISM="Corethron pennatum, Strain L29A3" /LENGTH=114 /DNA_ID=CAMNT_0039079379 /DNA_START=317 /DNA_END=658 /DNA_ORIENTATION=-
MADACGGGSRQRFAAAARIMGGQQLVAVAVGGSLNDCSRGASLWRQLTRRNHAVLSHTAWACGGGELRQRFAIAAWGSGSRRKLEVVARDYSLGRRFSASFALLSALRSWDRAP